MMKAMLSQPMAGKTDEEIIATREKAIKALEARGYEIVNTLFTDEWYNRENMEKRGVCRSRFASLQSHWKICLCAMRCIFVKAGSRQEDAALSMMRRLHTA